MARSEYTIGQDMQRAAGVEAKKGHLISHPLARFNLSLGGSNPDWLQRGMWRGSNPSLREQVQEHSRKITVEGGQRIDTLLLNPDILQVDERKRGLVYITEFNTSITSGPCNYRLYALANLLGSPVLGLNNPGIGESSNYTKGQLDALIKDQDFGPTAEALVGAIEAIGMKEISLVGVSMGGWSAPIVAKIAQERRIKVNDIILVAPPGSKERTSVDLIKNELSEGKYLDLYQSRPYDPEMRKIGGLNSYHGINQKLGLATVLARAFLHPKSNLALIKSMAKGTLEKNVRSALKNPSDGDDKIHVTFMDSSSDGVSLHTANNQLVSRLKEEFPGQIHSVVIPGETHFFYENGNRFAALVGLSLIDSPLLKS